jgi:hypothetical protein
MQLWGVCGSGRSVSSGIPPLNGGVIAGDDFAKVRAVADRPCLISPEEIDE